MKDTFIAAKQMREALEYWDNLLSACGEIQADSEGVARLYAHKGTFVVGKDLIKKALED